ncbi:MAG: hypothetical protein RLZZ479_1484, partial [Bacteroidota bacterium]
MTSNFQFVMGKTFLKYSAALLLLILASCAKRGSITGGAKDTIAPVLTASFPKNFSTEFKANTIKLTFKLCPPLTIKVNTKLNPTSVKKRPFDNKNAVGRKKGSTVKYDTISDK